MPTKQAVEHPPVEPVRRAKGPRSVAPKAGATHVKEEESDRASTSARDAEEEYDEVDRAGMDSFPASDPPSYNPGHT
jgi:hypothetical protein